MLQGPVGLEGPVWEGPIWQGRQRFSERCCSSQGDQPHPVVWEQAGGAGVGAAGWGGRGLGPIPSGFPQGTCPDHRHQLLVLGGFNIPQRG